jgi:hypothetical protein
MKQIRYFIIALVLLSISAHNGFAQNSARDDQAIKLTKQFYTAYLAILSTRMNGLVMKKKLDSVLAIYCAPQLRKNVYADLLDHDPFSGDMLTDLKHLSTLSVVKNPVGQNVYNVSYIAVLPIGDKLVEKKNTRHVTLVPVNGKLKINTVYADY